MVEFTASQIKVNYTYNLMAHVCLTVWMDIYNICSDWYWFIIDSVSHHSVYWNDPEDYSEKYCSRYSDIYITFSLTENGCCAVAKTASMWKLNQSVSVSLHCPYCQFVNLLCRLESNSMYVWKYSCVRMVSHFSDILMCFQQDI